MATRAKAAATSGRKVAANHAHSNDGANKSTRVGNSVEMEENDDGSDYSAEVKERKRLLVSTLRELQSIAEAQAHDGSEAGKHAMRTRIGDLAIRLSRPHFQLASNAQLFLLLRVACFSDASGAAHLATHALRVLRHDRIAAMSTAELTKSALFIARRRQRLPASDASNVFELLIERLLEVNNTAVADGKAEAAAASLPLDESVQLVEELRKDKDFPQGYALEYLRAVMIALPSRRHELTPAHVATVCQAVCWWRYSDRSVVDFFVDAVDICLKNVDTLSARDASFILDAYATVGYKHTRLFLTLGQHVGDMGEDLVDADAARVIRAFEKTDIEFGNLRVALESAMRLKRVFKRPKKAMNGSHIRRYKKP